MKPKNSSRRNRAFFVAFGILTLLCWCPVGYGSYGPVERLLGIPIWAVLAFGWAALLFLLEWFYLFRSNLAMNDDQVPEIIAQLEAVDIRRTSSAQGD